MNKPLEFPKDMPEDVRRAIGKPTADAIRAWQLTQSRRRLIQAEQRQAMLVMLRARATVRQP